MDSIYLLVILYVIATLDGMFSGICAASGQNGLIRKRRYYLLAMIHGMLWAQAISIVGLGLLTFAWLSAADRSQRYLEIHELGVRMVAIYGPYTLIVLAAFLLRAIPSVDLRSATSTLLFGPLTIARPAVIAGGAFWALMSRPGTVVVIATVLLIGLMLPFRAALRRWFRWSPLPDQIRRDATSC